MRLESNPAGQPNEAMEEDPDIAETMAYAEAPIREEIAELKKQMPGGVFARLFNRREIEKIQREISQHEESADWWSEKAKKEYLENEENARTWLQSQHRDLDNLFSRHPYHKELPPPSLSPERSKQWGALILEAGHEGRKGWDLVNQFKSDIEKALQAGEHLSRTQTLFSSSRTSSKEIAQNMSVHAINGVLGSLGVREREQRDSTTESGNERKFRYRFDLPDVPQDSYGNITFTYAKDEEGSTEVTLEESAGQLARIEAR